LRRGEGGPERLLTALSAAFVQGLPVDWPALLPETGAGRPLDLPTYAFQHRRYWLDQGVRTGDPVGLGLTSVGHPLLGAAVTSAHDGSVLFTGRLSAGTHTWLADHVVLGAVILPGTVFAELVGWAGGEAGTPTIGELTLHTPLVLPATDAVRLQVVVGAPDAAGAREVSVHSRPETADADEPWTRHATGSLTPDAPDTGTGEIDPEWATWPPVGAVPLEVDGFYERLVASGVDYGPAFRGMRAAWRRGDELFADVALDAGHERAAARFAVHPALLDAAIQTLRVDAGAVDAEDVRVAFAWQGVRFSAGAGPTGLRVRIAPAGEDAVSLRVADSAGRTLAVVDALTVRPVSAEQLRAAGGVHRDSLFRTRWSPFEPPAPGSGHFSGSGFVSVPGSEPATGAGRVVLLGGRAPVGPAFSGRYASAEVLGAAVGAGEPVPDLAVLHAADADPTPSAPDPSAPDAASSDAASSDLSKVDPTGADLLRRTVRVTAEVLAQVAAWVEEPRLASARLVVVTRRSVAVDGDDHAPDPTGAAVWGAVRAFQHELPDRVVLVDADLDEDGVSAALLQALASAGEPCLALRAGQALVPTLVRVGPADRSAAGTSGLRSAAHGTVVVTGADGALAGVVAGHLVAAHGVRRLVLLPGGGRDAGALGKLAGRLTESGAEVEVAAWTPGDRDGLRELLDAVTAEHPLVGVLHAADAADAVDPVALGAAAADADAAADRAGQGPVERPEPPAPTSRELLRHALELRAGTAWALHEFTADRALAFFVTFSSAGDLPGFAGHAGTAAADAFVDALAAHRHTLGLPAVSLAWGPAVGRSGPDGGLPPGLKELSEPEVLALFDAALGLTAPAPVLARIDRAALRANPDAARGPLRDLLREGAARAGVAEASDVQGAEALLRRLAALTEEERERELLALVRTQAASVLGHPGTDELGPERAFKEVGFDSLMAVELRNRLMRGTGVQLRSTLVFDYPNPLSLARHVLDRIAQASSAATPMLADLDRLHETLPTALAEGGARDRIAERLRALLALCEAADDAGPDDEDSPDDLDSASDDELFSLVDQGFE
ncbi:KR domain-containing protein, partial [Kitasatospora sp. NPDC059327]|uniref:type I polyketide synthase n=1 Tax=Kitasatospora sp. NPDC059327 TaxID=3346803 RepID=UPI0036835F0E